MKKLLLITSLFSVGSMLGMAEQSKALAQRDVPMSLVVASQQRRLNDLQNINEKSKKLIKALRFTPQSTKDTLIKDSTVVPHEDMSELDRLKQENNNLMTKYTGTSFVCRPLGSTRTGCFVFCVGAGAVLGAATALATGRNIPTAIFIGSVLGIAGTMPPASIESPFGGLCKDF